MTATDWLAIIGALTGVAGTVMGVITTYDLFNKNRVKLRVTPKVGWVDKRGRALTAAVPMAAESDPVRGQPPNRLAIRVVNLSAFPVSVDDVGFGPIDGPSRFTIPFPELPEGISWPVRLESRQAVTAFCKIKNTERLGALKKPVAYAQTDCGTVRYGTSPMFRKFIAEIHSTPPAAEDAGHQDTA